MTRSYAATHRALRRARGPARGCACVVCGRSSAVWACYPCADADLLDGTNSSGRPVTYVADLTGYAPMCWTHANGHDRDRAQRRRATAHLALSPDPDRPATPARPRPPIDPTPPFFALIDGDWRFYGNPKRRPA